MTWLCAFRALAASMLWRIQAQHAKSIVVPIQRAAGATFVRAMVINALICATATTVGRVARIMIVLENAMGNTVGRIAKAIVVLLFAKKITVGRIVRANGAPGIARVTTVGRTARVTFMAKKNALQNVKVITVGRVVRANGALGVATATTVGRTASERNVLRVAQEFRAAMVPRKSTCLV